MSYYQLTYGTDHVVTRWLTRYFVDHTGTLRGTDVYGKERVVGPGMPYSLAERDTLPPKIRKEVNGEKEVPKPL